MQETVEFRVNADHASRLFHESEGETLAGLIRKVKLSTSDPRFSRIGELQKEIRATSGGSFFYGWVIRRRYSRDELKAASLFHLTIGAVFEPAGEECGTKYDESVSCPRCGSGAEQVSELYLDLRKLPNNRDIARTIADEWVVSQRLAEHMIDAGLSGFELNPIKHKARYIDDPVDFRLVPSGRELLIKADAANIPYATGKFWVWLNRPANHVLLERAQAESAALRGEESKQRRETIPVWYQLVVNDMNAEVVAPTRVGIDPFDDDQEGQYRCDVCGLLGLNLLSELSIDAKSLDHADIVCSRQFIGVRRGLLRPARAILVSPKFLALIESARLRSVNIDVAYLV